MSDGALLSFHLSVTAFMTGLIWFVQIVHYPLFASVGRSSFVAYEKRHASLTTRVVAPMMLIELALSTWVLVRMPASVLAITGGVLLIVIWASTAFVQVPCHARLANQFDERAAQRLVRTNWVRTAAWTVRCAIAVLLLARA